jgi:hypothetical protein
MRLRMLVVTTLAGLVSLASIATAEPPERGGWLFGLGFGAGSAAVSDDATGQGSPRETGFASNLRVGYTLRPDLSVGLELNSWIKNIDDATLAMGLSAVAVSYYPRGGLVLRGGLGLGMVTAEAAFGPRVTTSSDFGFGLLAAAGYEFQLIQGMTIGPHLTYAWSDQPGYTFNEFSGTVDVNWYFGTP